jgi:PKD repeat protein
LHEKVTNIMGHGQRVLGGFAAACIGVATLVAGVVGATPASATTTTRTTQTTLSGSRALHGVALADTSLLGVTVQASGLDGTIDWQQSTTLSTQYDADAVRQGRSVDPVDTATRPFPGTMVANWSLAGLQVAFPGFSGFDIGTIGLSSSGPCNLQYGGDAYVCHLHSDSQTILDSSPTPGPYVNAALAVDLTITPQALATMRSASVAGTPVGTTNLALGESPVTDPLGVGCDVVVGDHLTYALGTLSTTPGVDVQASLQLQAGTSVANPAYPASDPNPVVYLPPLSPSFAFAPVATTIAMSGPGTTFDLGGVLADDQPVTADAGGPYAGTEGTAITFQGSTTANCGAPTLHWEFSDGGSADGAQPSHVFADNGTYTGTLTATKGAQTATSEFSVTVSNVAPTADAGADTSSGVGTAVAFNGTATDPGSVDQASLQYSWDFGDGSPTATGADVTHSFTDAGAYDATLTVCDKDGACDTDVRQVTVGSKQPSMLLYFGDLIGRTGQSADFRAIVFDRRARPLVGRVVTFTLGDQSVTATTDSRGIASTTATITARRGLHTVTASWRPGDAQYTGASMTLPFFVLAP